MKPQPIGRYTPTPSYEELQAEIERLRLTDAEREAMADFCPSCRMPQAKGQAICSSCGTSIGV